MATSVQWLAEPVAIHSIDGLSTIGVRVLLKNLSYCFLASSKKKVGIG